MKAPKPRVKRMDDEIRVSVNVNGSEVVGSIGKIFPYTGKWQAPTFYWENVEGHEVGVKAALRFTVALSVCIDATTDEWNKLPASDRVKIR